MLKNNHQDIPVFGSLMSDEEVILSSLRKEPVSANVAYQLLKDQLIDEGNARQNLATFCQTYMEPEVTQLMAETMEKNAIDKSEYPQTAEIEQACVNILSDLWQAPKNLKALGTSTVGSSEACMLAGLAMKFNWRNQREERGLSCLDKKPNLVISSGYQVCWEKFCVYWDIELREVPMDSKHLSLDIEKTMDYVDEYTIGIVGILGITYTGKFDNIETLNERVEVYNKTHEHQLVIHVDGASGGMFTPFVNPDHVWDFRLKNVVSINTSGHKYGLVYPGIGWVVWRDEAYLPKELIFEVSYLGGSMPTMAINFSRSASQIIGQYYNFYRFGFNGYRDIHLRTQEVAMTIAKKIEETGLFEMYNTGENIPIVCYALKKDSQVKWTLYDLADRLQMRGWQVPAYPLPKDLDEVVIQRIVCRADLGKNRGTAFINDFNQSLKELEEAHVLYHEQQENTTHGFTH
ncbi:glutamate decarboxylase [Vagococcus hydrophili]|uniref:Glutamate decarboxylase n=1 Tax=Vagococcus hydrophili TaxID=2714947 RepID=A0A6G8AV38_9ENTE|nr:glutamate decarboxylase [Vagococcus hydrophili]